MILKPESAEEAISILIDLREQGIFFLTAIEAKNSSSSDFASIGWRINNLLNDLGIYGDARIQGYEND